MRPRHTTTTVAVLVALGSLATACGGGVAGDDRGGLAAEAPAPATTTSAWGRHLSATATPTTSTPGAGGEPDRSTVPATTVAPSRPVVARTDPPAATVPAMTAPPVTVAAPTAPGPVAGPGPGSAGGAQQVPAFSPYTVLPGLTGVAALTGLPAPASIASAPVLVVKVDNVGSARPQWALDRADVVVEENVEGATRFMALFHSDVPAEVGPVRSARTTDIDLLSGMNRPVLAWSGGNPGVTAWIRSAAEAGLLIDVAAVRSNCYRRESSRRSPHNLVASTSCVLGRGAAAGPARALWAIDAAWTPSTPTSADGGFEVRMDNLRAGWTWDPATGTYLRSQNGVPHVAATGTRITAANVVVVYATHVASAVDARSPEAITVGSGAAVVHRDGVAIAGTWSRASALDPFAFTAADGTRIPLQVGRTFVELARAG